MLPCFTMLSSSCCWTNLLFLIPAKLVQLYRQWEADIAMEEGSDSDSDAGSDAGVESDVSTKTLASAHSKGITPRGSPASTIGDSDAPVKAKKTHRRRPLSRNSSDYAKGESPSGLFSSNDDDDDDDDEEDDEDKDDTIIFSRKRSRRRNSDGNDSTRSKKSRRSSSVSSVTPRKETAVRVDLSMAEGTCSIYCSIYCLIHFLICDAFKFMPTF